MYCTLGACCAHYRIVCVPLPIRYLHVGRNSNLLHLDCSFCPFVALQRFSHNVSDRKRFNTLIFPSAALFRLLFPPFFAPVLLFHTPSPSLFIPFVFFLSPPAPSRHFVILSSYTAHTLRHSLTNPFIAPQTLPSFPPDPWRTLFPLRRDAKSPENVSGKSPHGCARCVKR